MKRDIAYVVSVQVDNERRIHRPNNYLLEEVEFDRRGRRRRNLGGMEKQKEGYEKGKENLGGMAKSERKIWKGGWGNLGEMGEIERRDERRKEGRGIWEELFK